MLKEDVVNYIKKLPNDSHLFIRTAYSMYNLSVPIVSIRNEELHITDPRYGGYTLPYQSIIFMDNKKENNISASCTFGSDPEFFFLKGGKVIPSTKVITAVDTFVKPDGFQGELNPSNNSCREVAGSYIAEALERAVDFASKQGATLGLDVGYIIPDDVWKSVPLDIKRFGCSPTTNVHEKKFKRVTGLREKFRAGAGHIHVGFNRAYDKFIDDIVVIMDIVAGNTCVLIDRDVNNSRRRVMYGRAGEYRQKPYGLEYRVLSNFWLKHYVLWSMSSALVRNAFSIAIKPELRKELLSRMSMTKVRKAINDNDKELALENFLIYRDFLRDFNIQCTSGIDKTNVDKFLAWATTEDPISYLNVPTVEHSLNSWREKRGRSADGFEKFISKLEIK